MVAMWKTPEQVAFLKGFLPTYFWHIEEGKVKDFWAEVIEEWFKHFPLRDLPSDMAKKDVSVEKACTEARARKIQVSGC